MNLSEMQAVLNISLLLGGLIFNLAIWWYKIKDLEERLKTASKRIGGLEKLTYRIINYGNRKLDWDFPFYDEEREQ